MMRRCGRTELLRECFALSLVATVVRSQSRMSPAQGGVVPRRRAPRNRCARLGMQMRPFLSPPLGRFSSTASAALLRRFGGGMPVHRDVAGLIDDAIEPGADRRESLQVEIAFVREVRGAGERDGGGRVVGG